MGKNLNIYNTYREASIADPPSSIIETNSRYLSENFQSLDLDGNVQMNKEAYMGFVRLLLASFPDLSAVIHEAREEGDNVFVRSHFEGTHSGDLDLSALGMGVLPASGKKIVWPEAGTKWQFDGDKIVSIQAKDNNGGMGPFLAALGMTPPSG